MVGGTFGWNVFHGPPRAAAPTKGHNVVSWAGLEPAPTEGYYLSMTSFRGAGRPGPPNVARRKCDIETEAPNFVGGGILDAPTTWQVNYVNIKQDNFPFK